MFYQGLWCKREKGEEDEHWGRWAGKAGWAWVGEKLKDRKKQGTVEEAITLSSTALFCEPCPLELRDTETPEIRGFLSTAFTILLIQGHSPTLLVGM